MDTFQVHNYNKDFTSEQQNIRGDTWEILHGLILTQKEK